VKSLAFGSWIFYDKTMRHFAAFLAFLTLAGCASTRSGYEEPLARDVYQKVNIASYAGAASAPGAPAATARGTRYQSGSISSAAADWARWPAGTLFRVLATGELFEVDDFTDDIVGKNTLLVYKPAAAALSNSGTHYVTVEIIRWGSFPASAALLRQQKSSTSKKILVELLERHPEAK
jgi:3D (Asp-Asp-Asp) domain-containing protein